MQIIGHRGVMGLAPENTLEGFELAVKRDVDVIEFDVRLTRDGELVVSHDADLERLAGQKSKIRKMTLNEVRATTRLDGSQYCSLDQALDCINTRKIINIEIKEPECVDAIKAAIEKHPKCSIMISSFILGELVKVHDRMPNIPVALLRRWVPLVSKRAIAKSGIKFFGMKRIICRRWTIRRAHKQGLITYAYTTDNARVLARLERWGLDLIVRNQP